MRNLVIFLFLTGCCSYHSEEFEMERLSKDVLGAKGYEGLQIELTKIPMKGQ